MTYILLVIAREIDTNFLYLSPSLSLSLSLACINYKMTIKAAPKGDAFAFRALSFRRDFRCTHCRMLVSNSYLACGTGIWLTIEWLIIFTALSSAHAELLSAREKKTRGREFLRSAVVVSSRGNLMIPMDAYNAVRDASREKRDVTCTHTSDTRVAEKTLASSAMIARRCLQSVYNCISAEWACSVSSRVKWATTIYMRAYIAWYDGAKCFCYFPFFFVFVTAVDWFGNAVPEGAKISGSGANVFFS